MVDAMSDAAAPRTTTPAMGLAARLINVIFSPYKAFAAVAARPRWFGATAVGLVIIAIGTFWFLSTPVCQQAMLDQQVQGMEAFGLEVSDEQYEGMERALPFTRYFAIVQI